MEAVHNNILKNGEKFLIFTGNLTTDKQLGRKIIRSSTEEIVEAILATVASHQCSSSIDDDKVLIYNSAKSVEKESETIDRSELKITVKILLLGTDTSNIKDAVENVMRELNVNSLNLVMISLPPSVVVDDGDKKPSLDDIKDYWLELEALVNDQKLTFIGISDLDAVGLTELHTWAKVKPNVNQINMASCCVIPPDMANFAKENGIQLLTHSDNRDIMPKDSFKSIISVLSPDDLCDLQPQWIARYHVLVKSRGVVKDKGYILAARKTN